MDPITLRLEVMFGQGMISAEVIDDEYYDEPQVRLVEVDDENEYVSHIEIPKSVWASISQFKP